MQYYYAPLEGLTDATFRRLHHKYFHGVDRYFMPFISPTIHRCLTNREARELPKADSVPFTAVPQILTKHSEDFLWAASVCRNLGYDEVYLTLGCPSGTVVAKGKGSGMLRDLSALDAFLEEIFKAAPLPVSVKTRIGVESAEEFPAILDIYNRYPMKELTIHPRVRKVFYKGSVEMESFRYAVENSKNTLCFNGNLNSLQDESLRRIAYNNMIYIGDGLTDIPCMKLVKERGGKSIALYPTGHSEHVKPLVEDARINYVCAADYTEGSPLEKIVKLMIEKMAILEKLNLQEREQLSRYKQFTEQDS